MISLYLQIWWCHTKALKQAGLYNQAIHRSGITLWPLTSEVNYTDYLFILPPVSGWDILYNAVQIMNSFIRCPSTLSLMSRVHWGGWGKWAVVLCTISLKTELGLIFFKYCFHKMVPDLLSIPNSWGEKVSTDNFSEINQNLHFISSSTLI